MIFFRKKPFSFQVFLSLLTFIFAHPCSAMEGQGDHEDLSSSDLSSSSSKRDYPKDAPEKFTPLKKIKREEVSLDLQKSYWEHLLEPEIQQLLETPGIQQDTLEETQKRMKEEKGIVLDTISLEVPENPYYSTLRETLENNSLEILKIRNFLSHSRYFQGKEHFLEIKNLSPLLNSLENNTSLKVFILTLPHLKVVSRTGDYVIIDSLGSIRDVSFGVDKRTIPPTLAEEELSKFLIPLAHIIGKPESPLKKLKLKRISLSLTVLQELGKNARHLTHLTLAGNLLDDGKAKTFFNALRGDSLYQLAINNHRGSYNHSLSLETEMFLKKILGIPSLRKVFLNGNQIKTQGAKRLAEALIGSNLTSLHLADNPLKAAGAQALAVVLRKIPLKILDLENCSIGDEGAHSLFQNLPGSSLELLNLNRNDIKTFKTNDLDKERFQQIPLKFLDLYENEMNQEGAEDVAFCLENFKKLEELNLENNKIDDTGAQTIACSLGTRFAEKDREIGNQPPGSDLPSSSLSLNLSKNFIQDEGARQLAESIERIMSLPDKDGNKKISLSLKKNYITAQGTLPLIKAGEKPGIIIKLGKIPVIFSDNISEASSLPSTVKVFDISPLKIFSHGMPDPLWFVSFPKPTDFLYGQNNQDGCLLLPPAMKDILQKKEK